MTTNDPTGPVDPTGPEAKERRLQQEMQQTRASLTEKLEALEQKVVGTVEEATSVATTTVEAVKETVAEVRETVKETVGEVKDTVKESVDTVKGTVKDWFDLGGHVDRHPWLVLGGSVAVGYFLGTVVVRRPSASYVPPVTSHGWRMQDLQSLHGNGHGNGHRDTEAKPAAATSATSATSASTTSGAERPASSLRSTFAPELSRLKSLALGVLIGTARDMLLTAIAGPAAGPVAGQLKDVIDSFTRKVGGEPIAKSPFVDERHESQQCSASRESTGTYRG